MLDLGFTAYDLYTYVTCGFYALNTILARSHFLWFGVPDTRFCTRKISRMNVAHNNHIITDVIENDSHYFYDSEIYTITRTKHETESSRFLCYEQIMT